MMNMLSKCDNMHKNEILYALISINNLANISTSCTLSDVTTLMRHDPMISVYLRVL